MHCDQAAICYLLTPSPWQQREEKKILYKCMRRLPSRCISQIIGGVQKGANVIFCVHLWLFICSHVPCASLPLLSDFPSDGLCRFGLALLASYLDKSLAGGDKGRTGTWTKITEKLTKAFDADEMCVLLLRCKNKTALVWFPDENHVCVCVFASPHV